VSGSRARWRTRSRAPEHDSRRGEHLRVVHEAAKLLEAARAAATRRSDWTTRRRGSGTPARSPGRYGAQGRRQTARAGCSPPGTGLGRLCDDETAAEAGIQRRRRKLGFGSGGARAGKGGGSGEGVQGAEGGYK
jgi:hypothetical protein